jgi:hypothetical protein
MLFIYMNSYIRIFAIFTITDIQDIFQEIFIIYHCDNFDIPSLKCQ